MHQGEALRARRVAANVSPSILARAASRTPSWVTHTEARESLKSETKTHFLTALATCVAARQPKDGDAMRAVGLVLIEVGQNLLAGVGADG